MSRLLLSCLAFALASAAWAQDPCLRAARIRSGPGANSLYATLAPIDAGGADRSHLYSATCTPAELRGLGDYTRVESARNYRGAEALITRKRDELILLTYNQVVNLLPRTLKVRWAVPWPSSPGGDWALPGGLAAHANGRIYAVRGRLIVAIDGETGEVAAIAPLPEAAAGFTIAYDGVLILPDGRLLLKGLVQQRTGAAGQLLVLDPESLETVQTLELPERIVPRLMLCVIKGVGYVYATGASQLYRYRYVGGQLGADPAWGEMPYLRGQRAPGLSAAALGEWVVIQSNSTQSPEPLVLSVLHQIDAGRPEARRRFRFPAFGEKPESAWSALPLVTDGENRRIYTATQATNQLVALDFDPASGLTVAYALTLALAAPPMLMGPPEARILVTVETESDPLDASILLERIAWRDAKTGEELQRSEPLPVGGGLPLVPAFGGTFYHLAPKAGLVSRVEFTHEAPAGGLFDAKKKKPAGKKN